MIGERIRQRRVEVGKTVRQLAEECGVTASYISQLERDLVEPSITSLRKITKQLNVPIYYVFTEQDPNHYMVKKAERMRVTGKMKSISMEFASMMSNNVFTPNMILLHFTMEPKSKFSEEPLSHDGDEILLIMKGSLRVIVNNVESIVEEGDSIYIRSGAPHDMINDTDEEVEGYSTLNSSVLAPHV